VARGEGHVTAIVVPWECEGTTLSMAVTAVKSDGWAIEHTNLGTIRLVDAGHGQTHVAIIDQLPHDIDSQKLADVFDRFGQHLQSRFHLASPTP
jgi:hypothetical protein